MRLLVGLMVLLPLATQSQEATPLSGSQQELARRISNAPADSLFSVDMEFAQPVRLSAIRDTAAFLDIPRVLAFIDYDSDDGARRRLLPFRIGVLYADAWLRESCSLRIAARDVGADSLLADGPENWFVSSIAVTGSAYAIRELTAGTLLPPARIARGDGRQRSFLEALQSEAEMAAASPILVSDRSDLPADCEAVTAPVQAAVLHGESISGADQRKQGEDFRVSVRRQLAAMTPDTPLTLSLRFNDAVTLDELAAMVSDYRIDGLEAELEPVSREGQMEVLLPVEISIHGEPVADQVRSARCRIEFAAEGLSLPLDWNTQSAYVSLVAGSVYLLLYDRSLADVWVYARSAPADLARLVEYYRRPAGERSPVLSQHPCLH